MSVLTILRPNREEKQSAGSLDEPVKTSMRKEHRQMCMVGGMDQSQGPSRSDSWLPVQVLWHQEKADVPMSSEQRRLRESCLRKPSVRAWRAGQRERKRTKKTIRT